MPPRVKFSTKGAHLMRILYAASTISHINNFHKSYIEALRAEGNEVFVMARGEGADFDIPFEKKLLSPKNTACRRKIRRIIEEGGFDAVILNTSLAAFHIRLALPRKNRPRVINIVHGYLFSQSDRSLKARILLLCEKIMAKRTDAILVMNGEDAKIAKYHRLTSGKIIMTRGMGAATHEEKVPPEEIRRRMQSTGRFVMCFVGELSDRKNQRALISALPEIKIHVPKLALWLVGEGEKKEELVKLCDELGLSDNVVFTGRRDNPCDFIRAADLYVSASRIEGMPFNIIEALGTGATVLCSNVKGHADLIQSGTNGYLFPLDDMTEFVRVALSVYRGELSVDKELAVGAYRQYEFSAVFSDTLEKIKGALGGD